MLSSIVRFVVPRYARYVGENTAESGTANDNEVV
jgi:hypothetical protein